MRPFTPIDFRQPRDFGEVLNVSILFIRQHFKPLFLNLLLIAGPFILVGSVLPGLLLISRIGNSPETGFAGTAFTSVMVNVLSFIVGAVMAVTIVYGYMLQYAENNTIRPARADIWRVVRQRFFNVLGSLVCLVILFSLVFGIIGLVVFGLLAVIMHPLLAVLVMMVAGTYITVSLSIFVVLRLHERVNFFTAVNRCFDLVRGKWWQTFLLLFVCAIVQSAIISIFLTPFYALIFTQDLIATGSTLTSGFLFITLMGIVFILAITLSFCLSLVVTGFQYFNLVETKESVGLLRRIQDMGSPEKPAITDLYEEEEKENY